MTKPSLRNKRLSKKVRRTPGGKLKSTHKRRKGKYASCKICGARIQGVRLDKGKLRGSGRVFSKELCHDCSSKVIEYRTMLENKAIEQSEIPMKYIKYVGVGQK
ncbi:hypothetical protein DRN74_00665 [Candidatus Micrarchaeota archaeon]|nr:MAG: hypothetical protein DRN74_00665 [Candidatus Micrarchaeota archaeon]